VNQTTKADRARLALNLKEARSAVEQARGRYAELEPHARAGVEAAREALKEAERRYSAVHSETVGVVLAAEDRARRMEEEIRSSAPPEIDAALTRLVARHAELLNQAPTSHPTRGVSGQRETWGNVASCQRALGRLRAAIAAAEALKLAPVAWDDVASEITKIEDGVSTLSFEAERIA
jgi:hypothetical protein